MPHARAEMYKRREDVQRGKGSGGVRWGKTHRPHHAEREKEATPLERKEPRLAGQHLVNIGGPSACGVVEGRR